MPRKNTRATRTEASAEPGKYLTFRLAAEVYGLEVLKVQEIVAMLPVTRVPQMPSSVRGVVNLRGRVIPVVDLRTRFGLPADDTEVTCIVIVLVAFADRTTTMGVIVDEVRDVADVSADTLGPVPEFGPEVETRFLTGVAMLEENVVLLLDIDRVLSETEVAAAEAAVGA